MAKKKVMKEVEVDEEVVDQDVVEKAEPVEDEMMKVTLPVMLKIGGIEYPPGPHVVSVGLADTMIEMVDKKIRADRSIFIGNNYLVERMLDRTLKVTQVDKV